MKHSILLFFSIFTIHFSLAQAFEWAVSMGDIGIDRAWDIQVDNWGNVYTIGTFEGTADFDPGPGTTLLTPQGVQDIFIQKLDKYGNLVWVKRFGAEGREFATSIALDELGNVYATGEFASTVDFDPNAGVMNLTSNDQNDIFLLKLDSDGNFLWAKNWGGSGNDEGKAIAIDKKSNLYLIGSFSARVNFNPGSGDEDFVVQGITNTIILKLDSDGDFIWAKDIGGQGSSGATGSDIAIDNDDNIYVTGTFGGIVDFDPNSGVSTLDAEQWPDVFIQKLNSNGNFKWVRHVGGEGSDTGSSITIDEQGNTLTIGRFQEPLFFNSQSGQGVINPAGGDDIFIQKLDKDGNLLWLKAMGGQERDVGHDIAVDKLGNIYTTGTFYETVDFDPNDEVSQQTSEGLADIFIQKLDNDGQLLFVERIGAEKSESGLAITVDGSGNIYTTGSFRSKIDFNPDPDTTYVLDGGTSGNIFILKLKDNDFQEEFIPQIKLFPNPNNGIFYIELPKGITNADVRIIDARARTVYQGKANDDINKIDLRNLSPAIYNIRVFLESGEGFYGRVILSQ